jgi:hypothetical protein
MRKLVHLGEARWAPFKPIKSEILDLAQIADDRAYRFGEEPPRNPSRNHASDKHET